MYVYFKYDDKQFSEQLAVLCIPVPCKFSKLERL